MSELNPTADLVPTTRVDEATKSVIASVRGEIDLHNSPDLRGVLLELLAKHEPKRLVLNLSQVPYMDSSAIAVLVEALQKIRKSGGRVFFSDPQPPVEGLLGIGRLGFIFFVGKKAKGGLSRQTDFCRQ